MSDLLIRDVPASVVSAIDARAALLGLSRSEYLRRQLSESIATSEQAVTVKDLSEFAEKFSDLEDPSVMSSAWR